MKRGVCRRLPATLVLGLGLILASGGAAQPAGTALEQGRACLEAGRFEDAVAHLRQAFRDDPANVETSFLLGQAAFGVGDYEGAAVAFDRVLEIQPDLERARLELARSYYHMGLFVVAEELFREVYTRPDTPAAVRRTIDGYLTKIREARSPHAFGGTLTVAIARDDNARVSPSGTVSIPGLPPLSVPVERDLFTAQSLVLQHHWTAPGNSFGWASELLGYNALYQDQDDLDVQYLRLDTGPRWSRGRTRFGLGLNAATMEKDYDRYLRSYGARTFAEVALARRASVRLEIGGEDRRYWQDEEADGLAGTLSVRPTWVHGRHGVTADVGIEVHDAREGSESYDRIVAGIGYQLALPWRLTFLSTYTYENWRFDAPEPLADSRRHQDIHSISLGLRRMLGPRAVIELRHKLEISHCNSELYDYDRNVTSLSLTYGF